MWFGSQQGHKHQVSCEVVVVVTWVSPHTAKASMPSRLGPHHLAEGCEFVFTQALMNCGLCGLNESALLLIKGTWEDNKEFTIHKLLPFHSWGGCFNKRAVDGRCSGSISDRPNQPRGGNKTPGVFVIHQEHAVLCHGCWLPAKSKATHCTAAKRQRQLPLCSMRAVRGGVGGYADH